MARRVLERGGDGLRLCRKGPDSADGHFRAPPRLRIGEEERAAGDMSKIDIDALSRTVAYNINISDSDMRCALTSLDDELNEIESGRRPIPIDLVFTRAILRRAQKVRDRF